MKAVPVIIPNNPLLRQDTNGVYFHVLFSTESIAKLFETFKNQTTPPIAEMFINDPSDVRFDDTVPLGSLMAVVPPDNDNARYSFEFCVDKGDHLAFIPDQPEMLPGEPCTWNPMGSNQYDENGKFIE